MPPDDKKNIPDPELERRLRQELIRQKFQDHQNDVKIAGSQTTWFYKTIINLDMGIDKMTKGIEDTLIIKQPQKPIERIIPLSQQPQRTLGQKLTIKQPQQKPVEKIIPLKPPQRILGQNLTIRQQPEKLIGTSIPSKPKPQKLFEESIDIEQRLQKLPAKIKKSNK